MSSHATRLQQRKGTGRRPRGRVARTVGTAVLLLGFASLLGAQEPVRRELKDAVELLRLTGHLEVAGDRIGLPAAVAELYEDDVYDPVWSEAGARSLVPALRLLEGDGLRPEHYHLEALESVGEEPPGVARSARLDLLRSDALLLALRDLRIGRANTERPREGTATVRALTGTGPDEVRRIASKGNLTAALDAARPDHFAYHGLMGALEDLRRLEAGGGWDSIPPGPALHRDGADVRVPRLRRRLAAEGYPVGRAAPGGGAGDLVMDSALEAAVRAFQHRHGLIEDGVVGTFTRTELNVPLEARIDQVRLNLERARWILRDVPDTAVVVNIAGARVYLLQGTTVAFESRGIVGRTYSRTPVFQAPLRYVELNPSWTVPPGIVGEILAQVRAAPDYLARQHMRLLDAGGRPVDPSTVDVQRYSARSFPYTIRQDPGPWNALGRIKFGLPNPYNVYLHDTPSRELFARDERTFSHGCVRVEDPLELAELVLDDPAWDGSALEAAVATGRTRTLPLDPPLPVLVQYWTASTDLHGELHFYRDVYGRDGAVLARLDRP